MSNRAVFLDRDRTIIEDPGYLSDPSAVKLLPGADLAIKSLRQAGYVVVVVTNQSGIARGLLTEDALEKIHAEMRRQLRAGGRGGMFFGRRGRRGGRRQEGDAARRPERERPQREVSDVEKKVDALKIYKALTKSKVKHVRVAAMRGMLAATGKK